MSETKVALLPARFFGSDWLVGGMKTNARSDGSFQQKPIDIQWVRKLFAHLVSLSLKLCDLGLFPTTNHIDHIKYTTIFDYIMLTCLSYNETHRPIF